MTGPLAGTRIVELYGIGPVPFAGTLLAGLGAEVIRVDRADGDRANPIPSDRDVLGRSRRSIAVDLKHPDGREVVLRLVEGADGLIEGFRPGVLERLGLGYEACRSRNERIVLGRATGWGQEGPLASRAGHDLNYIAVAGVLAHIGREGQPPTPPLSLVGDFGGGGMLLALGVVSAIFEAGRSGTGQVVDAAMLDGAATLMGVFWGLDGVGGFHQHERGRNGVDGGAPFYDAYACADGRYVSIAAIEPKFHHRLLELLGLGDDPLLRDPDDRATWPAAKARLASVLRSRSSAEWCALLEGEDVCFAPVLTMAEAAEHPHNVARRTFVEVAGQTQPAPAPRFSRTVLDQPTPPVADGHHTDEILAEHGFSAADVERLRGAGAVR